MERWNDLAINVQGESITMDGVGFSAIGRLDLLLLLQDRARSVGIEAEYNRQVVSVDEFEGADLIVAADGVNSLVRNSHKREFGTQIEMCLNDHPKVRECAVLGVEQKDQRMTLKAFIVPKVGIEAGAELTGELQGYVKQALLPYKYPRLVEYLESLPKTGTGKIDRQALTQVTQS